MAIHTPQQVLTQVEQAMVTVSSTTKGVFKEILENIEEQLGNTLAALALQNKKLAKTYLEGSLLGAKGADEGLLKRSQAEIDGSMRNSLFARDEITQQNIFKPDQNDDTNGHQPHGPRK